MATDKRSAWRRCCAACGSADRELHEHHLVPRVHGGADLPTVMLCFECHSLVHGRRFRPNHAELTRAGLAAAKARGIKLGNPKLRAGDVDAARQAAAAKVTLADEYASDVLPFIEAARAAGAKSLGDLARALIARGVLTPGGNTSWRSHQVRRILARSPE